MPMPSITGRPAIVTRVSGMPRIPARPNAQITPMSTTPSGGGPPAHVEEQQQDDDQHATCGLIVMELGSGSESDLLASLDRMLPRDDRWVHRHGAPGHGADHVVPALVSPSLVVPVVGGRLALGTWQSIALLDTNVDNERRTVRLSFVPG